MPKEISRKTAEILISEISLQYSRLLNRIGILSKIGLNKELLPEQGSKKQDEAKKQNDDS